MSKNSNFFLIVFIFLFYSCDKSENSKVQQEDVSKTKTASIKQESLDFLFTLTDKLLTFQINDKSNVDYGALYCKECHDEKVIHTRAAEAVFPFAIAYKHSNNDKYLQASINVGNWLIKQQEPDGSWKETPEEWTGTTADQLLMMAAAYPIIEASLSGKEKINWKNSIKKAADYLTKVMSPEFASINYCATTTSTLTVANSVVKDTSYLIKAKILASQVIHKMDADGFISGEGGRLNGVKHGVDVGYDIDMSLWGLGLFAKLTNNKSVTKKVKEALSNHLYFVYPNGSIDGSWSIRSNKWTTYGSATADGCQILFSLYAQDDARYRTAAIKNLNYLKGMRSNGLITYGPDYSKLFKDPPCLYPTFARAKNLALAIAYGDQNEGPFAELPTDKIGWIKHFPTLDVVQTRTKNMMATITAYTYKDPKKKAKSKYMHRPAGGSISNLWVKDHGFLQTSSQTKYSRWEPMHFPEAENIKCLTPRIEFEDSTGYFTNLYEFDGTISVSDSKFPKTVRTNGELKSEDHISSNINYSLSHVIKDNSIIKTVEINNNTSLKNIRIVEPIVEQKDMRFRLVNDQTVLIEGGNRTFKFEIISGNGKIELGENSGLYWSPFPSLKCYPIEIILNKTQNDMRVSYQISVIN